jgi:hypothetical protein
VNPHIVVAFRMTPAGMMPGPDGTYLNRARSICARGEALGGRLVAWSAVMLAMAWDIDSIEEAILLATSVREGSSSADRAWAGGLAEGELEPLAPDGQRMQLAWGEALLSAVSLARVAGAGEVLVDGDVRALRSGQLALLGARSSSDSGRRVRGWRLDLDNPWRAENAPAIAINVSSFPPQELSSEDVIEIVERASQAPSGPDDEVASSKQLREPPLVDRVRGLVDQERGGRAETLADLRRSRVRVDGGPPSAQCQAALALSMGLLMAGRAEEALLDAMDALARAREAHEPRAIGACLALLAKVYASAGFAEAASALRGTASSG